jgi:hypothetical protein
MNRPSVEASDLTTAGKFMPHATSLEKKRQVKRCGRGDAREDRGREIGRTLEKLQSDSREGE